MTIPMVSVLIPAYRPNWLDLTISSILSQSFQDFELIISDDSAGNDIERVVAKWGSSRITYCKNPNKGIHGSNRDHLIYLAKGKYIKFVFDDDFLLPQSLEKLVNVHEVTGCGLSFHNRHFVDSFGRILQSPQFVVGNGNVEITRQIFFRELIAKNHNAIGEPSNMMYALQEFKKINAPFSINGRPMKFLTDVALQTMFVSNDLGVMGIADFGSSLRMHPDQTSAAGSGRITAGHYEWEFIRRWAKDEGYLTSSDDALGKARSIEGYKSLVSIYPELQGFLSLNEMGETGQFLSPEFLAALSFADEALERRLANIKNVI